MRAPGEAGTAGVGFASRPDPETVTIGIKIAGSGYQDPAGRNRQAASASAAAV